MRSDLTDADYVRLRNFRGELRDFLRWSEQAADDAGLTPALHQLMLVIRGHDGVQAPTIGDVAKQLRIRHHSTVELAKRAEDLALLTRERDPIDKRQVRLSLTELGSTRLEQLTSLHLPRIDALASALEQVTESASVRSGH